jgi:sec-independent protein translocase protein TatA
MGGLSLWHWLIVGMIVLLLFGKGRFSDLMGDVAKGIKSFKKGMAEDDEPVQTAQPTPRLQAQAPVEPAADPRLQPMKEDTRPHG